MYSCLRYEEDGRCASPFLYFLSRHETIDHHELTVLETIAKAVCILPEELAHTSVHEKCLYNDDLSIKAIYPVKNGSCNWNEFVGMPVVLDDLIGVYHEIAVAKKSSWGMASVTSRFEAGTDNKLKTTMHYSMSASLFMPPA
uniref:Uncharacterized protein n=1 Tax=Plectus sambesii TaxID=2011161 RepID=A0A914VLX4_9BILA